MSDPHDSNGLIPTGPRELNRWSGGLISRGLNEVALTSKDAKTESLTALGSIFDAAKNGDIHRLRAILAIDPTKANDRDPKNDWRTPLHYAAENGHVPIIEILLAYGSEVNAQTGEEIEGIIEGEKVIVRDPGKTPLLLACFNAKTEAAVFLIQKGAGVDAADYYDYTALHAASARGDLKLTQALLENGARTDFRTDYSEFSEECGWESGFAPLHIAARNGNAELIELLLSHGANIDIVDRWERTPLIFAARMGYNKATEFLLYHGANVNAKSQADPTQINRAGIGTTSLHHAVEGGHEEVVRMLIKHGADIDALNEWAESPLHFAASDGFTKIVEYLLDQSAIGNLPDIHGETPLDRAKSAGKLETADAIARYLHSGLRPKCDTLRRKLSKAPVRTYSPSRAPTREEMLNDPEILDIVCGVGNEYFIAGVTDKVQWHASLYADLEGIAEGLGDDLESLFPLTWRAITGEKDYVGGIGGIYGSKIQK